MFALRFGAGAAAAAVLALSASAAIAQDIGVPSCDTFLKNYEACIASKAPAQTQAQLRTTIDQIKANWKQVAATPDGKKQLEPVCKQTADQLKAQVAPLGCSW